MDARLLPLLKQLSFSSDLPDVVLTQLAELAALHDHSAGEVLFREGSAFEELLIIAQGRLALEMHVPGRGEVRLLTLGAGDLAAWSALVGNGQMTATGRALDDLRVLSIPARDLQCQCEADSELGYFVMRQVAQSLANRLVATRLQLLDLFSNDPAPISEPMI
jgi:CRP-like cAMP-binding protein